MWKGNLKACHKIDKIRSLITQFHENAPIVIANAPPAISKNKYLIDTNALLSVV